MFRKRKSPNIALAGATTTECYVISSALLSLVKFSSITVRSPHAVAKDPSGLASLCQYLLVD